jgi:hypothetical protein
MKYFSLYQQILHIFLIPIYIIREDAICTPSYFLFKDSLFLLKSCVSCCKASDRHAEWRTAYVVKTSVVAELYRRWLTTMLTADTALEVLTS